MPYKGGVQLLPETQRRPTLSSYTSGNSYFYFGVAVGIGVIVVGAILGSYKAHLLNQIDALDGQLQTTEDQRNKQQEQTLLATAKQSTLMTSLLGSKIYWSQALGFMEQMMQSGVRLTKLDASLTKGTIGFTASADSYASVARQIAAFIAGTGVDDISVTSIKSDAGGSVIFVGELKINTRIMLNKATPK